MAQKSKSDFLFEAVLPCNAFSSSPRAKCKGYIKVINIEICSHFFLSFFNNMVFFSQKGSPKEWNFLDHWRHERAVLCTRQTEKAVSKGTLCWTVFTPEMCQKQNLKLGFDGQASQICIFLPPVGTFKRTESGQWPKSPSPVWMLCTTCESFYRFWIFFPQKKKHICFLFNKRSVFASFLLLWNIKESVLPLCQTVSTTQTSQPKVCLCAHL